jgi:hypothetical protein
MISGPLRWHFELPKREINRQVNFPQGIRKYPFTGNCQIHDWERGKNGRLVAAPPIGFVDSCLLRG